MRKKRSSMRQVPWVSWEEWNWVANELFSDSPGRISAALNRVDAWQSRGHVPVAVEISAGLVAIHQRDSQIVQGGAENVALPQDLLRMMYAMAIQRLVNGVVDQSQKHATSSVADRAEAVGLPRVLVDIRHEAAHGELPELILLQSASRQGLAWLKLHYWEQQRDSLKQARATMKSKLLDHTHVVAEGLRSAAPVLDHPRSEDEEILDANLESNLEARQQEMTRARKRRRDVLFSELLDLSLSTPQDLVSIIVDDGLLRDVTSSSLDRRVRDVPDPTGSSEFEIAWKYTLRELSFHLPRLPAMLLIAIMKDIRVSPSDGKSRKADNDNVPLLQSGANVPAGSCSSLNRLTSWCIWLLGKGVSKDVTRLSGKDLRQLKVLQFAVASSVKVEFDEELLGELLRLCLRTAVSKSPLVEVVPLIARRLGGLGFQKRTSALTQLGSRLDEPEGKEDRFDKRAVRQIVEEVQGEERQDTGDVQQSTIPPRDNGNESSTPDGLSLGRARSLQESFLARHSFSKAQSPAVQSHGSNPNGSRHTLLDQGCTPISPTQKQSSHSLKAQSNQESLKRWNIVENWRPCAIGMIPAPGHCAGIVPSLDLKRPLHKHEPAPSEQSDGTALTDSGKEAMVHKVDGSLGKRTNENQISEETLKRARTGLHVRFNLSSDGGRKEKSPKVTQGTTLSIAGKDKEQSRSASLVRGCLLQQGALKLVTPDRMQTLKTRVRIL